MTVHGARGRGVAERQVEHGAQVLLELAGDGAVHRPVAAVVRAHRELVDDVCRAPPVPGRTSNSSTASTPVTPSSPAIRSAASVATDARSGSRPGAGARTSVQMPSVWTVSTTGHAAAWPRRAAGDEHRELADEVDLLLEEQAALERTGLTDPGDPPHPIVVRVLGILWGRVVHDVGDELLLGLGWHAEHHRAIPAAG